MAIKTIDPQVQKNTKAKPAAASRIAAKPVLPLNQIVVGDCIESMNALPPTPSVWDANSDVGWVDEWRRRIDENEPWLLEWLRHPLPDASWRRGSVRTGPDGAGYDRLTCPVFLIAGWADKHLGLKTAEPFFASDYFEQLYGYAVELINRGKAYVCDPPLPPR